MRSNTPYFYRVTLLSILLFHTAGFALCQAAEPQWDESALLKVLESDAPSAEKAITCKRLAVYGTAAAVPALSELLPDPQLSSWARIALEAGRQDYNTHRPHSRLGWMTPADS